MANPAAAADSKGTDSELEARLRRLHVTVAAWGIALVVLSAAGATWLSNRVLTAEVRQAAENAELDTRAIAQAVDRMFHELIAIPQVLSSGRDLRSTVERYNKLESGFSAMPLERRKAMLAQDAVVVRLSKRLTTIRDALKYDLLYVLDKNGVRVITSDWDREPSLLGTDLAEREYFKEAMSGETGHLFAYSRVLKVPVFFFSSPLDEDSGPIGAVVARQTSQAIGSFLSGGQHKSIIVDKVGMIVATSDPAFYMRHLGALAHAQPSAENLREFYAQPQLRELDLRPPPNRLHTAQWVVDGSHYLLTPGKLTSSPYDLYVLTPAGWVEDKKQLHVAIGAMVLLFGLLVLLLVDRGMVSLLRRRHYTRVTRALNEKLATANREKDRYLGIAAHDLRNPLSSMRGLAQLMMETPLEPEEQRDFLETIHRTSDEMLVMVNDLLDVAVIESGKLELRRKDEDVARLLRQRVRHQEPSARTKGIGLKIDSPEVLAASVDAARFSQVIDNLVSNAIKFSPQKTSVHITLSASEKAFILEVRDEGPGMSEDDRKLLFKSFQKLSARPTGGEKSTGLGLAIVKKVVDAHRGTIEVDSAPGRGTRFTVTIPLAAPQGAG